MFLEHLLSIQCFTDNSGEKKMLLTCCRPWFIKQWSQGPEVFMLPYAVPTVGVLSLASCDSNTTQEFWVYGSLNMAESVS